MRVFPLFASLALIVSASVQASHDDSVPVGLTISITNVDTVTGRVDFDVTLTSASNNKEFNSPWLGNLFWYNYDPPTPPKGGGSGSQALTLISPVVNAISFGDGQVIAATQIPIVGTTGTASQKTESGPLGGSGRTISRGSFSHTYTAPGNYTIRATAVGNYLGNIANPGQTLLNGTWLTANAMVIYNPNNGTTFTRTGSNTDKGPPALIFGIGGLAATGPLSSVSGIPIPTLADWSRLLLGLMVLLTGALVLIRR